MSRQLNSESNVNPPYAQYDSELLFCYFMLCFRGESNTSVSCRSALLYIASSKTTKGSDSDLLRST